MSGPPYVIAPKAMVRNAEGKYLFLRRSLSSKHFKHQWEMPGGKMDPGETLEQTLLRETLEETGLHVRITRVLGAAEGSIPTYRLAYIMMEGEVEGPDSVTLSEEHDDFVWATPAEALKLDLCPAFVPFVQSLAE